MASRSALGSAGEISTEVGPSLGSHPGPVAIQVVPQQLAQRSLHPCGSGDRSDPLIELKPMGHELFDPAAPVLRDWFVEFDEGFDGRKVTIDGNPVQLVEVVEIPEDASVGDPGSFGDLIERRRDIALVIDGQDGINNGLTIAVPAGGVHVDRRTASALIDDPAPCRTTRGMGPQLL